MLIQISRRGDVSIILNEKADEELQLRYFEIVDVKFSMPN